LEIRLCMYAQDDDLGAEDAPFLDTGYSQSFWIVIDRDRRVHLHDLTLARRA